MCVQPAPCKLWFTEVPAALFLASPGPNNPLHTPASKVPTYHFQILKTMIQLFLSGLWSSPSLWPNPMDTSLFSSYLATSYFLEHSLTLAFVTSLSLDFPDLSGSFLFLHCCLHLFSQFHMLLLLRAQSYPSFLSSLSSSFSLLPSPLPLSLPPLLRSFFPPSLPSSLLSFLPSILFCMYSPHWWSHHSQYLILWIC